MVKKKKGEEEDAPSARRKTPAESELDKVATETYLLQIKDLTEKLDRQKKDNDNLQAQCNEIKRNALSERENDKDVIEFLKVQLAAKQKELLEYENKLRLNSHEADVALTDLQTQLHIQKDISQQTIQGLQDSLKKLREEMDELNEFKIQKADIENEIEELKMARENDRRAHKEKLHEVEMELLREKDKMLKEKDQQVKEIRESLLNLSKSNLDKTTKLTIIENDQITSELAYQTKQVMETVEQNKRLSAENVEMKRKMDLMAQIEKDLSKKNTAHQKLIKSLQAKIQALESEFQGREADMAKEISLLREEATQREARINELENSYSELLALRETKAELQELLAASRKETEDGKRDMAEISIAVSTAFENIRRTTIEFLMKAESEYREHNKISFYEFSEGTESATLEEKERMLNLINEKNRTYCQIGRKPRNSYFFA